ncbi:MAG TPA: arylsulfotransferase family protein [Solirubrobacteraceae bacterium]|nr:arylsulfotransferase family protein [Solirubrobacteraceae bacterium]
MAGSRHGAIDGAQTRVTRRGLLRAAAAGGAGLALSGGLAELIAGALAGGGPTPPGLPRWRSRPDLRIPALAVLRDDPAASRDPIFVAPYNAPGGAQAGAVIADAHGEAIWENPLADRVTTDFRVQRYRGAPVLTWWEGSIELGHGVGEYVIADAAYRPIRRVQAARGLRGDLHEFVVTPQDTALLTSYVVKDADLSSVGGPRKGTIQDAIFQEIDLASGRLLLEWHSLDHIPLAESYAPVGADWDYFHINSVDLDGDGDLLISGRSTHALYKIARHSGDILWRLGGRYGDFTLGAGTQFAWQHDARRQPDGTLSVFDNGATPAVEPRSRGLIIAVDEQAMTAGLVHQYTHPGVLAGSQGSVQLLGNGNVFVGWGEVPRVSEFARDGRLLFDAILGRNYESYRAFRLPWTGRPADAPALALGGGPDGAAVAYASWNGATEVSAWQLLAGAGEHDLRPVLRVAADGFETSLRTPRRAGPSFAVRALDAGGATLGQSRTVAA